MCTARQNTNNSNCSCSGHNIPQHGIVHDVIACCDIPHYDPKNESTHKRLDRITGIELPFERFKRLYG